ncbi:hypothetical protein DdX_02694 [Ditylenchus destructor]|uniref:Uncharacterized protein n=1 Tax=Ditylenchus destructor TaxID=166010 RepID=A0AAD4RCF2_9BILA|nr:hypothetical protein DdX_02694 [Ditylenchus destructor]
MLILLEPFANARLIFPGDVGKKRIIIKDRDKYPITQTVNYRLLIKAQKADHPIAKRQTEERISTQTVYQLPKRHFYKSTHYQSRCAQGGPCPGVTAWAEINQNR